MRRTAAAIAGLGATLLIAAGWSEQEACESLEANTHRAIERWVCTWGPKFVPLSDPTANLQGEEEIE